MNMIPERIAEIGPGESLGIGLSAVLSGVNEYYGFDLIGHSNITINLKLFDELVDFFKSRAPIPNDTEFPNIKPKLDHHGFPTNILTKEILGETLSVERTDAIRKAILNGRSSYGGHAIIISYVAPWHLSDTIRSNFIELIISQAVLEHVTEINDIYRIMSQWLTPAGFISHQIDYSAHETSSVWNGHWAFPSWLWRIIMHGRSYGINRLPHSVHKQTISRYFTIKLEYPLFDKGGVKPVKVSNPIYCGDDFIIKSALIVAQKANSGN
jgi:hypothetical protein